MLLGPLLFLDFRQRRPTISSSSERTAIMVATQGTFYRLVARQPNSGDRETQQTRCVSIADGIATRRKP